MTTTPPQKLWVLLKSNDSTVVNRPIQVPTKDCDNVDDFIDAIKKKLPNELDKFDPHRITLHLTEDSPALESDDSLPAPNNSQTALVVKAQLPLARTSHSSRSSSDEPHQKRLKRWNEINQALLENGSSSDSTPYTSTRWSVVSPIFLASSKLYTQSSMDIPDGDFEVLVTILTWIFRCYGRTMIEEKNKAQRLHLIAPVLWSVVQLLPDVEVRTEYTLNGKRVFTHGRFEFVLTRQVHGVIKRICIVEDKHKDLEQGLAQDLLGCEVVADLDNSHAVYGIVTNFDRWIFVKDMDEEIALDENNTITFDSNGVPVRDQLKNVVGKIYHLLS